ncbi:class C sortase [Actinomyces glycerinitolerans]|uniref:Sortase fam: sortase n=1 Tax=Actinomyces glycerinitolerans TaxID=1892869 RepID=A0A1M4RY65_9ACTO|nr:class C sortase [Actinomyces glycerinitolerans]SHE24898.1 sortase fam: sortase [Actinomyces glycerinitolerans]
MGQTPSIADVLDEPGRDLGDASADRPAQPDDAHGSAEPPKPPSKKSGGRPNRSSRLLGVLPFILALAGALVLAYPVLATQHNNARQQEIADQYQAQMDAVSPDVLAAELASADEYNQELASSPILDPWLDQQRPDTPQYQAYLAELDLDEVMARIVIPKIHVDLPVYHGTEAETLSRGVGHLFGTALPVGGTSTHSVLTGHTGLGSATLFDDLTELEEGDVFYITAAGRTLKYEVNDVRVVLPTETESLNKVPGEDLVTLITCTPYGVNTHRLLVTGTRVAMDPVQAEAEQAAATPAPMRPWMLWLIGAVVVILTVLTVAAGRRVVRRVRYARRS